MKHRGRLEIIVDMLEVMPSIKTRMMYTANLSFDQLNNYLRILVEKKLCRFDDSDRNYYRTDTGNEFLWKVKDTLTYCMQVLGEGNTDVELTVFDGAEKDATKVQLVNSEANQIRNKTRG